MIDRSAAICAAVYGMNSTPRPWRTQSRTEKVRARCACTNSNATAADAATERIEPNMRAFSGSRNGCAGEPATRARSSELLATVRRRQSSPGSWQPDSEQRRVRADRKVRAYPRHSRAEGSSVVGINPLASCSISQDSRISVKGSHLTDNGSKGLRMTSPRRRSKKRAR